MGFIREPKGVDFFVNSGQLTEKDRKEITEYIKNSKKKQRRIAKRKIHARKKEKVTA